MPTHKKINTNDLPNNIGQTVIIKSANNTDMVSQVVALGPDGTTVLMKSNKYWFYQPIAYDATKTVILVTP
jgi:hypothetical protein